MGVVSHGLVSMPNQVGDKKIAICYIAFEPSY